MDRYRSIDIDIDIDLDLDLDLDYVCICIYIYVYIYVYIYIYVGMFSDFWGQIGSDWLTSTRIFGWRLYEVGKPHRFEVLLFGENPRSQ